MSKRFANIADEVDESWVREWWIRVKTLVDRRDGRSIVFYFSGRCKRDTSSKEMEVSVVDLTRRKGE
jgi:hypothetical protein